MRDLVGMTLTHLRHYDIHYDIIFSNSIFDVIICIYS